MTLFQGLVEIGNLNRKKDIPERKNKQTNKYLYHSKRWFGICAKTNSEHLKYEVQGGKR